VDVGVAMQLLLAHFRLAQLLLDRLVRLSLRLAPQSLLEAHVDILGDPVDLESIG
jgi:hypothetical protein